MTVKGTTYNGVMPPWESLGNKKIAAALTYIRQSFGNKAGEINEAQVAAVKKELESQSTPCTVDQIKAIPVDTKVEGGAAADLFVKEVADSGALRRRRRSGFERGRQAFRHDAG